MYLGYFNSLISDVDPHSWFMDVDPHSLIPPYHEAASVSVELCDPTASRLSMSSAPCQSKGDFVVVTIFGKRS